VKNTAVSLMTWLFESHRYHEGWYYFGII